MWWAVCSAQWAALLDSSGCPPHTAHCRLRLSPPHQRKQNHVLDRRTVREQHDQPVDSDAFAAGGRQAVLERADVIFVHRVRLEIAAGAARELRFKPPPLLRRIVELAERVSDLEASVVELAT